jgi:hypothetical protein
MLILSTDVMVDLSVHNEDLIYFSRELPGLPEETLLQYSYKWFVGSCDGCSCAFRHLSTNVIEELGFAEPEDWYEEDSKDIEATLKFITIIRNLVKQKVKVDCIDVWSHDGIEINDIKTLKVFMGDLNDKTFRFAENYRFIFLAGQSK